jgi:hypothetical protein
VTSVVESRVGELGDDDIMVTIDHPFGTIETTLAAWIKTGPGPRYLLHPVAARRAGTNERLPLSVIPLRYRNSTLSRFLIRLGILKPPWPQPEDPTTNLRPRPAGDRAAPIESKPRDKTSLLEELVLVEARNRMRLVGMVAVIWLAEELLLAGVESPSLILLAGVNAKESHCGEVDAYLEAAMVELGLGSHLTKEAWRVVAVDYARCALVGQLEIEGATRLLGRLYHTAGPCKELEPFWLEAEEWDGPVKLERPAADSLRREMKKLLTKLEQNLR